MKRPLVLGLLALPLAGLLANIAYNEVALKGATEWRIPVTGYDPRDPLRGHYIQFRYDWAVSGDVRQCLRSLNCSLCLESGGAAVRVLAPGEACEAHIDVTSSRISVRAFGRPGDIPQFFGRLFVSEASAPRLQEQLRVSPMVVVARLGNDGRLVNVRLEPKSGGPQ